MLSAFVLTALLALPGAAREQPSDASWMDRASNIASAILDDQSRFYIQLGGITTGAGLSVGPGVRLKDLAGGRLDLNAVAIVSRRKYLLAEASATTPLPGVRGLRAGPFVRRKYFPEEDFYGIGTVSRLDERMNYSYDETAGGVLATLQPSPRLTVASRLEYRWPEIGHGHDDSLPSIEDRYLASALPGLERQPDFLVAGATLTYEGADPVGHPRRGGRYEASLSRYWGRGSGASDFLRFDADIREYLPIVPDRHIIALHGMASLTGTPSGAMVPFYYLPRLGGGKNLRGYRELRFHDRNTLLGQAEYRWLPMRFIETALFYEVGVVTPRVTRLTRDQVLPDYGAAVRFGTDAAVFFRVEAAFGGRDGKRLFVKFSTLY